MKWLILPYFLFSFLLNAQTIEEDSAGVFAPNFSFVTTEGEVFELSTFRGEVVYLAFWASWCKPCIQGFEKYKDIRTEMAAAGVTLLNISIDSNPAAWKKAVEKYTIQGTHGLVPKSELMDAYQLYNVPRYEIVGKKGEFLYLNRDDGKSVLDNFHAFVAQ